MLVTGLCFHERFMLSWINSQIFALLVAKPRVRADIAFFMLDVSSGSKNSREFGLQKTLVSSWWYIRVTSFWTQRAVKS